MLADGSEAADFYPPHAETGSHLLQDALIEELLQFLVTVVDAELLEAVVFKVLCETETEVGRQ